MKTNQSIHPSVKRGYHQLWQFALLLCFLAAVSSVSAQPALPTGHTLNFWRFDDTNWLSAMRTPPKAVYGVAAVPSWSGNALSIEGTNAALLQYHVVETNGMTNLACQVGSVSFWFRPSWSSANLGGNGPGTYASFLEAGTWTTNASIGWWGLYLNPDGTTLTFGSQANSNQAIYLEANISWASNDWHQIVLTCSSTNSVLYVDGYPATNGGPVLHVPSAAALAEAGFSIGGDRWGEHLVQGWLDNLQTCNYPMSAGNILGHYLYQRDFLPAGPIEIILGGIFQPGLPEIEISGELLGEEEGGMGPQFLLSAYEGTTNLWLEIADRTNNTVLLTIHNTAPGTNYQVLAKNTVGGSNAWIVAQDLVGADGTNLTQVILPKVGDSEFFVAGISEDSDGDGLPDVYEVLVTHTDPNNADTGDTGTSDGYKDADGDGWSNLDEMRMQTDPLAADPPQGLQNLRALENLGGGQVYLTWDAPSLQVTNYTIYRLAYGYDSGQVLIGQVDGQAASFTTNSPAVDDFYLRYYYVQAHFASGQTATASVEAHDVQGQGLLVKIVRGADGVLSVMVTGWPADAQGLRIENYDVVNDELHYTDIARQNFTNGLAAIPAADRAIIASGGYFRAQVVSTNGAPLQTTELIEADFALPSGEANEQPFDAAKQQALLRDNLRFLLMAADRDRTFSYFWATEFNFDPPPFAHASPTNHEAVSFVQNTDWSVLSIAPDYVARENQFFRNFVYSTGDFSAGQFDTGVIAGSPPDWTWTFSSPKYGSPLPDFNVDSILPSSTTRWIYDGSSGTPTSEPNRNGIISDGNGGITLSATTRNWYGLPIVSVRLGASAIITPTTSGSPNSFVFQEVEEPVLEAVDYHFLNLTDELATGVAVTPRPGDEDFAVTNTTPLIIVPFGKTSKIAGWAKQRIVNGYTNKFAYLGQYFDKAYKADPATGLRSTNETGRLSPYGEFFPTEPGKVFLTALPDTNGLAGECAVFVIALNVDANHDGVMDLTWAGADTISAGKPMRFWVNNDYDRLNEVDCTLGFGCDSEEDDLKAAGSPGTIGKTPDCEYQWADGAYAIPSKRDLEDYTRLWIPGIKKQYKEHTNLIFELSVRNNDQTDAPAINLFLAVESDGGTRYLTDASVADDQISLPSGKFVGRIGPHSTVRLNDFFNQALYPGTGAEHFIWCGAKRGKGELVLQVKQGTNLLAETSAWLDIKDIKEMYERWTVGDAPAVAPLSIFMGASEELPADVPSFRYPHNHSSDTNQPYVLFVHGWNMKTWEKDRFAEAAFKRLYWQGFDGHFGSFRWPTFNGFDTDSWQNPVTTPTHFDRSEFNAWRSGEGLKRLLVSLNNKHPGRVRMFAHSMGNVVAGEALRLAGTNILVHTYVASQAALPAHAYDSATTVREIPWLLDEGTPNRYAHYPTDGQPAYFASVSGAARYVNFFNTNDYALNKWTINQNLKPDETESYLYVASPAAGHSQFLYHNLIDRDLYFPADTYELFAFCIESRCFALGAQPGVQGVFEAAAQVNLDTSFQFGSLHKGHSAQFRSTNIKRAQYWRQLITTFDLEP